MDSVEYSNFEIKRMARILSVSTSGFYKWRDKELSGEITDSQQRGSDLDAMIMVHHRDSNGTYGAPRITGLPKCFRWIWWDGSLILGVWMAPGRWISRI
jgi:hypothetical protein